MIKAILVVGASLVLAAIAGVGWAEATGETCVGCPMPPNPLVELNTLQGELSYPFVPAISLLWHRPGTSLIGLQRCENYGFALPLDTKCERQSKNWHQLWACSGRGCQDIPGYTDRDITLMWGVKYCYRILFDERVYSSGTCVKIPMPDIQVPIIAGASRQAVKEYYKNVLIPAAIIAVNLIQGHFQMGLIRPGDTDVSTWKLLLEVEKLNYLQLLRFAADPVDVRWQTKAPLLFQEPWTPVTTGNILVRDWMNKILPRLIQSYAQGRRANDSIDKMQGAVLAYQQTGDPLSAQKAIQHARIADAALVLMAQNFDAAHKLYPQMIGRFERRTVFDQYCLGTYSALRDSTGWLAGLGTPYELALDVKEEPNRCTGFNWVFPDMLAFAWPKMGTQIPLVSADLCEQTGLCG